MVEVPVLQVRAEGPVRKIKTYASPINQQHFGSEECLTAAELTQRFDDRERAKARLVRLYDMQTIAAGVLPGERALRGCCRWVAFGKEQVDLVRYRLPGPEGRVSGKVLGLQTCSSPWICPVCSAKICERRCKWEIAPGLARARDLGWHVLMVTWTIQHYSHDTLRFLLRGIRAARKAARNGKAWQTIRRCYGIEGSIRALEVTWSEKNGWHVHFHELFFCNQPVDRMFFVNSLRAQWDKAIAKTELRSVNTHGVHVAETYKHVEEYVAKFGRDPKWGVAQEMSKQPVKQAKSEKGMAPFQILGDYAETGDVRSKELFQEYAAGMKGFRQLQWTQAVVRTIDGQKVVIEPGLKEKLGVSEMSESEICEADERDARKEILGYLHRTEWACVVADGGRSKVEGLLMDGNQAALDGYLSAFRGIRQEVDALWIKTDVETGKHLGSASLRHQRRDRVRLEDPFADERDKCLPVGIFVDPLYVDLVKKFGPAEVGPRAAVYLRSRHAAGETVPYLAEQLKAHRELVAATPEMFRAESPLPAWLHKAAHELVAYPGLLAECLTEPERELLARWKQSFKDCQEEAAAPEYQQSAMPV